MADENIVSSATSGDRHSFPMTPENYMKVYYEWEKEYLDDLAVQMEAQSKKDFWRVGAGDNASAMYESGLKHIKKAREEAKEEALRLGERAAIEATFTGDFAAESPHLPAASEYATIDQRRDLDAIISSTRPTEDATWNRYLQAGWSQLRRLTATEKAAYTAMGLTTDEQIVEQLAGEILLAEKQRPLSHPPAEGSKGESAYEVEVGKKVGQAAGDWMAMVFDNDAIPAAVNKLSGINTAIELLETGKFTTGPTTEIRVGVQKWIQDIFGGTIRGPDGEPDLPKTAIARRLLRQFKEQAFGDPNKQTMVALAEYVQNVTREIGLGKISMTKGAISDKEMKLFLELGPHLSKSVGGNLLLLKMMRNVYNREIARQRTVVNLYKKLGEGFDWGGKKYYTIATLPPEAAALYFVENYANQWLENDQGIGGVWKQDDIQKAYDIRDNITESEPQVQSTNPDGVVIPGNQEWIRTGDTYIGSAEIYAMPDFTEPVCFGSPPKCIVKEGGVLHVVKKKGGN